MVLSFGLLKSGLFAESEATGLGLGTDSQQTIINEVATGIYYLGIYTGAAFDSIRTGNMGAGGTDTNNHTIVFTPEQLARYNYLFICVTVNAITGRTLSSGTASLRVESQETGGGGGGWSDVYGTTVLSYSCATNESDYNPGTIIMRKTLTAGEKLAGLDVKFTSTSTTGGNWDHAQVTNNNVLFLGAA